MKNHNKTVIILLSTLLALLVLTVGYWVFIDKASKVEKTFDMNSEEFSLDVVNPEGKIWEDIYRYPGNPCGAEYSFTLNNQEDRKLVDWTITLEFDNTYEIDSSWNGQYEVDGNMMTFTPEGEVQTVNPHDYRYFGAVLYSRTVLNVRSYTITGKMPLDPGDMAFTYILFIMYLVWFIFFGAYFLSRSKIDKIQKQRKHDIAILDQSIRTFTSFIDAKDRYTRNHSIRVAIYSKEIGRRLGLDEDELQDLYYASLLHDVGKIGIPDEILGNEGILSPEEFEVIKTHPRKGVEMLKNFTAIPNISDCAHYHHERFDGKGYPEGIKGEDIPLYARITNIADSFDVMSMDRSYQKALTQDKIVEEFKKNAGTQFDPKLVPIIIEMLNDGFTEQVREEFGPK